MPNSEVLIHNVMTEHRMEDSDRERTDEVRRPEPPLPEESGLSLDEYLAMQAAIGHRTRFRILRTLVVNDQLSASDPQAAVDVESHNFHYHLDELVDVGLVDKRKRRTADSQGFYTYYRPTGMGRGILEHGVEALMRRERAFDDTY